MRLSASTSSPVTTGHRNWLMRCRLRKKEGVADPSYGALNTAMVEMTSRQAIWI
jgi:hypothetical protein